MYLGPLLNEDLINLNKIGKLSYGLNGSDINKIVNTSLSTQNISSTRFSLSPNPAKDFTVLNGVKKGAKISVYDLSGKLLLSTIATESQFTINTTSFTKGVYMVKVDNQSVKLVVSK